MSKSSEKMRKEWAIDDAKRDAGLTTPEDIERFDNIQYSEDPVWNLLDVYRLKDQGKLPVIVIVHGGGWVYGSKEIYQFYGMSLAERGFAVVNASYRLAPEVKYPASVEDTNSVIKWVFKNSEKYNMDTENIFMVGDSAGAHILGVYCAICTDSEYAAKYKFKVPNGFVPNAIGMNCGFYAIFDDEGKVIERDVNRELFADFLPEKGTEEELRLIHVVEHVNGSFPPAYIMTCEGDFLKEQAPYLVKAYDSCGAEFVSKIYGDEEKPLYHVFHVNVREEEGQKCNDDECDFFKKHIK